VLSAKIAVITNAKDNQIMPRIAGINIPDKKRVEIGLTYVYGVGPTNAKEVLAKLEITGNPKFSELTQDQIDNMRGIVEKEMTVEGDLRQIVNQNIRRLKEISSYRGSRHAKNLPVRGQRTKTNGRTKRGKKVTMGSGRKKSSDKT
jgi:small subunit ribosomal protein S13